MNKLHSPIILLRLEVLQFHLPLSIWRHDGGGTSPVLLAFAEAPSSVLVCRIPWKFWVNRIT